MQITREIILNEFDKFIDHIFLLPEISYVQVRSIRIYRYEDRTDKLQEIMKKSYHDCYSDIDLSVMVILNPKDTITPLDYMKRMDRFGINRENCFGLVFVEENSMYRMILKNGMRYDFGFAFEYDEDAALLEFQPREEEYSNPDWPLENINRFWFVQIQALAKLYRKDFLIADHLANMNLNETLVLQMVQRDIEHGTNHHRYGYEEDLAYINHGGECSIYTNNPFFHMIADKLYAAALTYDELVRGFYPNYEERSKYFFAIGNCYEEARISNGN